LKCAALSISCEVYASLILYFKDNFVNKPLSKPSLIFLWTILISCGKFFFVNKPKKRRGKMTDQPISKKLFLDTFRLHYLEWESSVERTLVLVHGIGDNAYIWEDFARRARPFLRILAPDQRGHGSSTWPSPPAYSCEDYVADLEGFIRALELRDFILMGHSMGALHTTRLASLYPQSVAALIHVDIEAFPPPWNKKYLIGLYRDLPQSYEAMEDYVDWMKLNSPYADRKLLRDFAAKALFRDGQGRFRCLYDRELLYHFDPRYDLRPCLPDIRCPALVIRGEESRVMGAEVAQEMSRAMPRGRFAEIRKAAHPVHTDNPDVFADTVFSFLAEEGLMKKVV
jgi:pimeloyl-ACP methyl ester carboxylesterase